MKYTEPFVIIRLKTDFEWTSLKENKIFQNFTFSFYFIQLCSVTINIAKQSFTFTIL